MEQVRNMDLIVGEIANASGEQSTGIEPVNLAVSQMDKVTQNNTASAEESAASAEELKAQSSELQSLVEKLSVMVGITHGNVAEEAASPSSAERSSGGTTALAVTDHEKSFR